MTGKKKVEKPAVIALTFGRQQVACKRLPKNEFGLRFFVAGFTAFAAAFGIGGI